MVKRSVSDSKSLDCNFPEAGESVLDTWLVLVGLLLFSSVLDRLLG